jgi:hypothetical protein
MAIPNVKRFRPFCPVCNESFTVMAVLPKDTDTNTYVKDAIARHDHKAFQEAKDKMLRSASASRSRRKQSKFFLLSQFSEPAGCQLAGFYYAFLTCSRNGYVRVGVVCQRP